MTKLSILDDLRIASPCDADWDEMSGNDRVRHCGLCEKNVYNLSSMTRPQIETLIVETEGSFCGRLYQRTDGTMLTEDCPVGIRAKARAAALRSWVFVAALFTGILCLLSGARQETSEMPLQGAIAIQPEDARWDLGDVAVEPEAFEVKGEIAITPKPPKLMGKIKMPR